MLLPESLLAALAAIGFTAARLAERKYGRMAAGVAVALFFLNPLFISMPFVPFWAHAIAAVLFASVFCAVCLALEHWSAFMRAGVLTVLFSVGLWIQAWSVPAVGLSFLPWIALSRRRWRSIGFALWITGVGTGLYLLTLGLWRVFSHHGLFSDPWKSFALSVCQVKASILFMAHRSAHITSQMTASDVRLITVAWILLSLWLGLGNLRRAFTNGRADARTVMASLVCVSLVLGLASTFHPFLSLAMLAVFLGISAPLVAAEISRKEYTHHRGARWAGALGLLAGILPSSFGEGLLIQCVGLGVAGVAATAWSETSRLAWRLRWRSVLLGAYVGDILLNLLNR